MMVRCFKSCSKCYRAMSSFLEIKELKREVNYYLLTFSLTHRTAIARQKFIVFFAARQVTELTVV